MMQPRPPSEPAESGREDRPRLESPGPAEAWPSRVEHVHELTTGLYQLVRVRREAQDHTFVSKPVAVVQEFVRVCNAIAEGSFDDSARSVDFNRLDATQIKATGFFGERHSVWSALVDVGLCPDEVSPDDLHEGLLLWCPWLSAAAANMETSTQSDEEDTDEADLHGSGHAGNTTNARQVFVAAWAGDEVTQIALHPPFNLTLRLLIAMCPDIVFPMSPAAAAAFDKTHKPFESGEGITEDYSVQQHTSAHTALQVHGCKHMLINLEAHRQHRRLNSCGQISLSVLKDVEASPIALNWHSVPGGAALVCTCHVTNMSVHLECIRIDPQRHDQWDLKKCGPGYLTNKQIFLSEAFVTTLLQEAADLVATAEKCMPGSRRTDPEGNMDVHAFFDQVHRHPALAILQQMDPAGYGKVHESLKAIEADLQHIVQKAKAQAWNNAASLEDILQDFKGNSASPPQTTPHTTLDALFSFEDLLHDQDYFKKRLPPILTRNWVMEQLAVLWAMHLEVRIQSQSSFGRLEPLRASCPQATTGLPQEVVAEAANKGVGAYMDRVARATLQSIFHLQIVNRAELLSRISRHVEIRMRGHATNVVCEPGDAMTEWLVGHPHITEMIAMLAAKALQTPSSTDYGCRNGADSKVLLRLAVKQIATWIKMDQCLELPHQLDAMVPHFCDYSREVLRDWFPRPYQRHAAREHGDIINEVFVVEAASAGLSRAHVMIEVVMAAVAWVYLPVTQQSFYNSQLACTHGVRVAAARAAQDFTQSQVANTIFQKCARTLSQCKDMLSHWGSSQESSAKTVESLNADEVARASRNHAQLALCYRAHIVEHFMGTREGFSMANAVAHRLCKRAVDVESPAEAFPNTMQDLRTSRSISQRRGLYKKMKKKQKKLGKHLEGIIHSLPIQSAPLTASCHRDVGTWVITHCKAVPSHEDAGGRSLNVFYERRSTSLSRTLWTAHVLGKSAQGEDAEQMLETRVMDHEEGVDTIEMLGVAAGAKHPSIISVLMNPASTRFPTKVYVFPPSIRSSLRTSISFRMHQDKRRVLTARFEPSSRILALLLCSSEAATKESLAAVVAFGAFSPDFKSLQMIQDVDVSLQGEFVTEIEGTMRYKGEAPFVLLPAVADKTGCGRANKMAVILQPGCIKIFNILSNSWEPESRVVATAGKQWLCTPCRSALLAVHHASAPGRWLLDAYSLEDGGDAQPLFWQALQDQPMPDAVAHLPSDGTRFTVTSVNKRTYILAAYDTQVLAVGVTIQSINVENALTAHAGISITADAAPATNKLLNYVHSCCVRFPLDNCIGMAEAPQQAKSDHGALRCRNVRLHVATLDRDAGQRMSTYVGELADHALQVASHKPAGKLLAVEACTSSSVVEVVAAYADSDNEKLGGWFRTAMCLLPLQMSRCTGNMLDPMHDGEPRRDVDSVADDGDIDGMARALRLGLYESVLASHTGPVKFVCALGQQSVGKSYQLNHLGGTLFDVAGGRCTDGVWMSVRFMSDAGGAETAVVFLDCEGIGSPQRHEVEDMLHCLLVGAVSSLTMFKTHFAFTTELYETLKRLNKGAEKVGDICGSSHGRQAGMGASTSLAQLMPVAPPEKRRVFRGSIMFCLKDVPADSMRSTIRDFKAPLDSMVRSGDNFVSAIYNNKLSVSAFPGLSPAFYSTLQKECVPRLKSASCPAYASGADAIYTLKLMLMKMAYKDWTAIDRQLIVSKAKRLRALMPAVVYHGCEGSLSPDGSALDTLRLQLVNSREGLCVRQDEVVFDIHLQQAVAAAAQDMLDRFHDAGYLEIHHHIQALSLPEFSRNAADLLPVSNSKADAQAPAALCSEEHTPMDSDDAEAFGEEKALAESDADGTSSSRSEEHDTSSEDECSEEISQAACLAAAASESMHGGDRCSLGEPEEAVDAAAAALAAPLKRKRTAAAQRFSKVHRSSAGDSSVVAHTAAAQPSSVQRPSSGVMLRWTLKVSDHQLRLGSLVQDPAAAEGVLHVPEALLQEDLLRLRVMLLHMWQEDSIDKDANQFRLFQAALQGLVQGLLRRRRAVAAAWLAQATQAIADTPEASELHSALADHLRRLDAAWQVCSATCADCLLPCCVLGSHAQHNCGTDHRCKADCAFCSLDQSGSAEGHQYSCNGKAGHNGRHMCSEKPHACGKPCALMGRALNCNGTCAKEPQHEGECDCECSNHLCGAACSLPGCGARCKEPWGAPHKLHSCGATACPTKCPLCGGGCPGGHFHALEEPETHHMCGAEHQCMQPGTLQQSLCSCQGACSIEGEIERVSRRFEGRRDKFEYDAVTVQNMHRKVCTVKIPPGQMRHDGPCSCGRAAEEHYCGAPCPQCLYRCTKAAGHSGRHRAPHGNLTNSRFVATQGEFDLKGRKYAVGDSAEAETCDSFCSSCGRGHVHTVRCDQKLCSSALHDNVRHCNRAMASAETGGAAAVDADGCGNADRDGAEAVEYDEFTHDFFWEHMQFEDPVQSEEERRLFRICGCCCGSEEHEKADGTWEEKHCLLPIWHAPLGPNDASAHKPSDVAHVHVSDTGCLFPCKHFNGSRTHTFLVIDRSGSMRSRVITPDSSDIREHEAFRHGRLDNVLGVVYEAAHKYVLERASKSHEELFTFIPFSSDAEIKFFAKGATDGSVAGLLDEFMECPPERGTNFYKALQKTKLAVDEWRIQGRGSHKPVVILLTDSEDFSRKESTALMRKIMAGEGSLPEAEQLAFHFIGFGPGVDEEYIRKLASIGNGSHMTCLAASDMDRVTLVKAFSRIAARPALQVALMPHKP